MNEFIMWEQKIVFVDGWFIYMDGKGNNSVITHTRAREMEREYQRYQASMDVNRGGVPESMAYPSHGFSMENEEYVYRKFEVDRFIVDKVRILESTLVLPEVVGQIPINCVAKKAFVGEIILEKVILHEKVKVVGPSAFEGCVNLKDLVLQGEHVTIEKDALKDTAINFEQDVLYLNNTLFRVPTDFEGTLIVREGTTSVAEEALKDCKGVDAVILPKGVSSVGRMAFGGCTSLRSMLFPSTVREIGSAAFEGCSALESVSFPEGLEKIARQMFRKCENLKHVEIPSTVREVWVDSFEESGLFTEFVNSDAKELYIGHWLIQYKWQNAETLSVREGTVGIAGMSWRKPRNLKAVALPDSLRYIGYGAFCEAPISAIKLPEQLRFIGVSAFQWTRLKQVRIPKTVETVEQWAFMNCEQMERIIIEGADTEIVWPAITGRKDGRTVEIIAPVTSNARQYCLKYGEKYHLVFKPLLM